MFKFDNVIANKLSIKSKNSPKARHLQSVTFKLFLEYDIGTQKYTHTLGQLEHTQVLHVA